MDNQVGLRRISETWHSGIHWSTSDSFKRRQRPSTKSSNRYGSGGVVRSQLSSNSRHNEYLPDSKLVAKTFSTLIQCQ